MFLTELVTQPQNNSQTNQEFKATKKLYYVIKPLINVTLTLQPHPSAGSL